mgnify:CR=1 FL=1
MGAPLARPLFWRELILRKHPPCRAPGFRGDSAFRVRWAGLNLVNEGVVGALILYICWERQAVGVVPVCCLKAWAKAAC